MHRILTRVAGTYQGLIEYAELGAEVQEASGIRTSRPVRSWIGPVLCRVAQDEPRPHGEPPLTSLVVHKADGIVGVGYDEALALAGGPRSRTRSPARSTPPRRASSATAGPAPRCPPSGGRAAVSPRVRADPGAAAQGASGRRAAHDLPDLLHGDPARPASATTAAEPAASGRVGAGVAVAPPQPLVQPLAHLFRRELRALALVAGDDGPGGGHAGQPRHTEHFHSFTRDSSS